MIDYTNNDVLMIKKGDVCYLEFKILQKYKDKLRHAITLRHGGVSGFPVNSLNFKSNGKDKIENVIENVEIFCKEANFLKENICKGTQNHTDNILILDNNNKEKYLYKNFCDEYYDGYITREKNIAPLILTADCNAIIIYDTKQNIVANIHSGWKGVTKQIYLKVVSILINEFKSNVEDIIVCIGPSIRKCCFSSEDEKFKLYFNSIWKNENEYIYYEKNNKRFHIDLIHIIIKDLIAIGIKKENIADANICTACNNEDFFSYRIATQKGYEDYGLMGTIVELI